MHGWFTRPRAQQDDWSGEDAMLRQRLRLITGVFTGLLWVDNLLEHYRGAFRRGSMWAPILVSPPAALAGIAAAWSDSRRWQRLFLGLSVLQGLVGLSGFWFHQRALLHRVGRGWRMYLFHAWYGPPALAPLQYLGFSLLGLLATLPYRILAPVLGVMPLGRLLRLFVAINIPPLWAEIAYLHDRGSFHNALQWLPVATIPAVGAASAAATVSSHPTIQRLHRSAAYWMLAMGAIGTALHLFGITRQYGGLSKKAAWFNLLSGPPLLAPLQTIGLGLVALLSERARRRKR